METYISKEEMLKYHLSHMSEELAQVKEQGVQQGAQQTLNLTALNALKEGLPLQIVSKITSLPIAEIKKLKGQL